MTLRSQLVPNLIQGVSQQAAMQRRDSQCEAQFDCINSPADGCVARPGGDLLAFYPGVNVEGAFCYEVFRGVDEHYLIVVTPTDAKVYNLNDGTEHPVTLAGGADWSYLLNTGALQKRDAFAAQTINDYSFIANKTVAPAMAGAVSPARPKEALVFVKAGGYLVTYTLTLIYAGYTYRWTYKTPDNSAASNAAYIGTTQIAATFYRAMTGTVAGPNDYGTGGVGDGDTGNSGSGTKSVVDAPGFTAGSIGFNVEINGNLLRIWRDDGTEFAIETTDGVGDTFMVAFKDSVRAFSELPKGGFEGMTFAVQPNPEQQDSSAYFVQYVTKNPSSGYWEERSKPGALTSLNAATMPHAFVSLGPNSFEFRRNVWSTRLAGDGVLTAKDPGFIGKSIMDLFYHQKRLGILTEATADWSKARNVFTHFPDTVQTILQDAPVGVELAANSIIALARKVVAIDEGLYIWAQGVQFRVHSGQNPFRQDTVEAPDSSNFEFAESASMAKIGKTLYFATESGDWATVRSLQFQQSRLVGDLDVTEHVPAYIKSGIRRLPSSDTSSAIFVQTDGEPSVLALYNFLAKGNQLIQSAWNKWRLPHCRVVWCSVYRKVLHVVLQRKDGVAFMRFPLEGNVVDPGGEYLTRLDLRVTEAQCSDIAYSITTDRTTFKLPYQVSDTEGGLLRVATRTSKDGGFARGRSFEVVSTSSRTVTVKGDLTGYEFYVGFRIESVREESTFYLRSETGSMPTDRLNIRNFSVRHGKTGYYRIEVDQGAGRTKVTELKPILLGQANNAVGFAPELDAGTLSTGVDTLHEDCRIRIINDSFLPSRWHTAEYRYEATMRAGMAKAP